MLLVHGVLQSLQAYYDNHPNSVTHPALLCCLDHVWLTWQLAGENVSCWWCDFMSQWCHYCCLYLLYSVPVLLYTSVVKFWAGKSVGVCG